MCHRFIDSDVGPLLLARSSDRCVLVRLLLSTPTVASLLSASHSQHTSKKNMDPTLASPVGLWNGISCQRVLCELFLRRGQRENWHVSCSAGETAHARGAEVGEKAKLDVDSKFGHVSFTVLGFWRGCRVLWFRVALLAVAFLKGDRMAKKPIAPCVDARCALGLQLMSAQVNGL